MNYDNSLIIDNSEKVSFVNFLGNAGKFVASVVGVLYVIGFITSGIYLYEIGVIEFEYIKVQYIIIGIAALIPVLISYLSIITYYYFDPKISPFKFKERIQKLNTLSFWYRRYIAVLLYLAGILLNILGMLFNMLGILLIASGYTVPIVYIISLLSNQQFFDCIGSAIVLYIYSSIPNVVIFIYCIALRNNKISNENIISHGYFIIIAAIVLYVLYLVSFVHIVYTYIPIQFGGGKPENRTIVFKSEVVHNLAKIGFNISEDNEIDNARVLYESNRMIIIGYTIDNSGDSEVMAIKINKEYIVLIAKKIPPLNYLISTYD